MTLKFQFRIRTRHGLLVNKLVIHGRTQSDAERKLMQMYPHCEILEPAEQGSGIPRMLALHGEPSIVPGK